MKPRLFITILGIVLAIGMAQAAAESTDDPARQNALTAAAEPPRSLAFEYDLPEDGFVTIQLSDSTGMVQRILLAQAERKAGKNIEQWDGLDDVGKPLSAGTYTWRGLYHKGITTRYCFSIHNSGQPPYKTDDNTGGWGGDHGTPQAVCTADDCMVMSWSISESGWGIICTDLNGRKKWGIKAWVIDVASDGKRIFFVGSPWKANRFQVGVCSLEDGRPLNWGHGKKHLSPPPGGATNEWASGVAYGNGRVYVSWGKLNLIGVYDAKSGGLVETWPVPAPQRLAISQNGQVAVISGANVLVLASSSIGHQPSASVKATANKSTIDHQPLTISHHLDHPTGLAFDADGNFYVANAGKLQNVSVFDPNGKYFRSIGKAGGRPARGRYDPSGMYMPGGIAISQDGKLWVAETTDSPKRFSVWDTKTAHSTGSGQGAFVKEFFGGSAYFGWACMDPKKPDEIYCHNVLWKIDWTNNTCAPWSTIWRATEPDMVYEVNPNGYAGHFRVMTAKNGKQFGWGMSDYSPMLYMREGDIFKPIAGSIWVVPKRWGIRYPAMKEFYEKSKAAAYLWQDANDDQKVQENELMVSPAGNGTVTFNWIDEDLNAWCDAGFIFKPVRFAPNGRPVYDFSRTNAIPFTGRNSCATSLWFDPADSNAVYMLNPTGAPDEVGFGRWTRDGTLVWGFKGILNWQVAMNLDMGVPGKLLGLTMPLGVAGDAAGASDTGFTGAACYIGPFYLFTCDGIYVAMVMRNKRDGQPLGPDVLTAENIQGQLVKLELSGTGVPPVSGAHETAATGKMPVPPAARYFILAGDQDVRVTEILGLETVKRLEGGKYTITTGDARRADEARKQYEAERKRTERLQIVRGACGINTAPSVGRTLDLWRDFKVYAAYDATNLYIRYEVRGSKLINSIADPKIMFTGGNCLDIQIGADPTADPARKKPVPGDMRILVSRRSEKGDPCVVVYRPKIMSEAEHKGGATPTRSSSGEPIELSSPTGVETFDAIETCTPIKVAINFMWGGTRSYLTIPLDFLGLKPKPGDKLRMDLGVIYGNPRGTMAAFRVYWSNNSFSANVVNDVPTESRLEPAEWGVAMFE